MFGSRIIELEIVESTNNYALQLISAGKAEHGLVISADNQWGGRGRSYKKWDSLPNQNLTFSVILSPHFLSPSDQFKLSQAISLGILDFLQEKAPNEKFSVKWPNDIYQSDKKISGILIENLIFGNRFEYSVIGIGINLNQTEFCPGICDAISLKIITGKDFDRKQALSELLSYLNARYAELAGGNNQKIHSEYLEQLFLFEKPAEFQIANGILKGKIVGIDDFGRLIVEGEDGITQRFIMDEIKYLL